MEKKKVRYIDVFWKKAKKNVYKVAISIFSGVIRSILMLMPTRMIQDIINGIDAGVDFVELSIKGGLYIIFPAIVLVLYVLDTWMSRFVYSIIKDIRMDATQNLVGQSVKWINNISHQDVYNRVVHTSMNIADFYFSTLSNLIWFSTTIIVGFALMAQIDIRIATILVIISIFQLVSISMCNKVSKNQKKLENEVVVEGNTLVSDIIDNCSFIKLFDLSEQINNMEKAWIGHYLQMRKKRFKIYAIADVLAILSEIARVIVLLFLARQAYMNDSIQLGDVYALNAYITWMTPVFFGLQRWVVEYFSSKNNQERIEDILILPETEKIYGVKCEIVKKMEINNLTFKYCENGNAVLHDISLTGFPGDMIAIVGESGCGKSTLIKLLLRFETSYKGEIKINDIKISQFDDESFRKQISAAMQTTDFLEVSLRENLLISGAQHCDADIVYMLRLLGLSEMLKKLPEGLDTLVNQENMALSDGEKKRLGIARVLLSNASVMIFDEPTASLDNTTKFQVMDVIRKMCVDKIVIIVTHDKDVLLHKDKIVEIG